MRAREIEILSSFIAASGEDWLGKDDWLDGDELSVEWEDGQGPDGSMHEEDVMAWHDDVVFEPDDQLPVRFALPAPTPCTSHTLPSCPCSQYRCNMPWLLLP